MYMFQYYSLCFSILPSVWSLAAEMPIQLRKNSCHIPGEVQAATQSLLRVWGTSSFNPSVPFPPNIRSISLFIKDNTESHCFSLSRKSSIELFFLYSRHLREEVNVIDLIWGLTKKHDVCWYLRKWRCQFNYYYQVQNTILWDDKSEFRGFRG